MDSSGPMTMEKQMAKLKAGMSNPPTVGELKEVLKFSMAYARDLVFERTKDLKTSIMLSYVERKMYYEAAKKQGYEQYLKIVLIGIN